MLRWTTLLMLALPAAALAVDAPSDPVADAPSDPVADAPTDPVADAPYEGAYEEPRIDLIRADLRTNRIAVLTAAMALSDAEGALFWPIFRDYQAEYAKLDDRRNATLKAFGEDMDTMTDEEARRHAKDWLSEQREQSKLETRYFNQLDKVLGAQIAARFLQVEHQMRTLMDAKMAMHQPLIDMPRPR